MRTVFGQIRGFVHWLEAKIKSLVDEFLLLLVDEF